jgi:hypothetical protein
VNQCPHRSSTGSASSDRPQSLQELGRPWIVGYREVTVIWITLLLHNRSLIRNPSGGTLAALNGFLAEYG